MPEKDILEALAGLGLVILGGLTGHNYKEIGRIKEQYRIKDDCTQICASFEKSITEMRKDMNHGFERMYDKLEGKEDKD